MERMNRLGKSVNLLAVIAIASTGVIAPAIANTNITTSPGSLKLAQVSPSPTSSPTTAPSPTRTPATTPSPASSPITVPSPTRTPATTPSPASSPTTAPSPTRTPATTPSPARTPATTPSPTRTPATTPSPASSPTTAPSPASSPTTAPSPTSSPATTTNQNLCRRVIKPPQGLAIRREPSTQAAVVGGVGYQGRVTLTTNPPTTRTVGERDWVEISAPARGWISHSLITETVSNLAYCR